MSQHAINTAIDLIRDGWDDGDKWGSAINALFDIATVMDAAGLDVPAELEFQRSPVDRRTVEDIAVTVHDGDMENPGDYASYDEWVLATEYLTGNITARELRLAALTLNRYCDMCRADGLDY